MKKLSPLLIVIAFVFGPLGCAKKPAKSTASIRISSKSIQAFSTFPTDQRICFGFDISAEDLEFIEASPCAPKRSLHGGFVENGGELAAEVPQGEKRQIDLYAYLLPAGDSTSACPDWDDGLDYSNVYKVGGTIEPLDLFDVEKEVEVPIEAHFSGIGSDVKTLLDLGSCDDGTTDPGTESFTNINIVSTNADVTQAQVGDAIYLTFDTNHPFAEVTVLIFGTAASISDLGSGTYQATYTLSGSESEGLVPFSLHHSSGSATATTDGSSVNFDQTAPTTPTGVSRTSPAYVMGTDANPTFSVGGTEAGAWVEIFTDASCATSAGGAIAPSSFTTVTASGLTLGNMNNFYAMQTDPAGNASPCSTANDRYAAFATHPFISTWQTTGAGESITLPLRSGYNYSFLVDWGDGTTSTVTSDVDPDATHSYATPGNHTIILGGMAETLQFNNAGDKDKILTVPDLGDMGWITMEAMFFGCNNLTLVSGVYTSSVTSMADMFRDAPAVIPDTSGWDTSAVTDMSGLFSGATSANPNTSGWNTSMVTSMASMFQNATSANPDTSGWDTSTVTSMQAMFWGATAADPDVSAWDTSAVTSMASMFRDASAANPDVSLWDTSSVNQMAGLFQNATAANPDVTNWNTAAVTSMSQMFLLSNANPDVSLWDVSSVINMNSMFAYATSADPVVFAWDVSSVTTFESMFLGASLADPDVSFWTPISATTMRGMFAQTSTANPDVSTWDVSLVTDFSNMFETATAANPDVSLWNTASATDMSAMFWGATLANPDVSGFDTTNVTTMWSMFRDAPSANPDLTSFTTFNVTDMSQMFDGASSASPVVASLITTNVTSMFAMFRNSGATNVDLSSWDFASVTDMDQMFNGVTLTNVRYGQLLNRLDTQIPAAALTFDGGNSTCNGTATTAKANLIGNGWTIIDACP